MLRMCWAPRSLHMRRFGEKNLFPWLPAGPGLRRLCDADGFAPKPEGLSVPGAGGAAPSAPPLPFGAAGDVPWAAGCRSCSSSFPSPTACAWGLAGREQVWAKHPAPEGIRDPLSPVPPVGPAGSAPGMAFGPLLEREESRESCPVSKSPLCISTMHTILTRIAILHSIRFVFRVLQWFKAENL